MLLFQLEKPLPDDQLQKYFAVLDTDLDGKVSLAEYIASIEPPDPEPDSDEDAGTAAFRMYDRNGNGWIDKYEMKAALMAQGCMMDDDEVDEVIRGCDEDGDGQINIEEFLAAMG